MMKSKSVGWAAICFLLLGVLIVNSSSASASTNRSGLPWGSGLFKNGASDTTKISDFENWRGRPVDMVVDYTYRSNWSQITNSIQVARWDGKPYQLVLAVPFFPEDGSSNFAACAAGNYNSYWNTFGTGLVSHHQGNTIVRLGWEFNGDWYNHKVTTSNMTDWVACFKQVVTSIRKTDPDVKIDWNVNRGDGLKSAGGGDPAQVYPGDSYVDYIGIDEYDMWEPALTQKAWDTYHMGGAYGIQHWIDFAAAHGKKVSFPEWGLNHGDSHHGNDNPFYIEKMWSLFNSLNSANELAYEAYFDQGPSGIKSALDIPGLNPNSAPIYMSHWSTPPVTSAVVTPAQPDGLHGWYVHPVTVTLSAYGNFSAVAKTEYSLDGGSTWLTYSAPVTMSQDSQYTLSYRSTNVAGNVEAAKTIAFNLDSTAPTIALSGLEYGTYSDSMDITPVVTLSDNLSGVDSSKTTVTISSNGVQQTVQQGTTIPLYTLPLGSHTLIVTASDMAGNTSSQTIVFQTSASIRSMQALVTRFTNMGWIDNAGIANSLQSKLAANSLAAFVNEVQAQSGKHIAEDAARYLLWDAQAVIKG
nr:hypothetical protein [Paenibacillus sp. VKM B-2647]